MKILTNWNIIIVDNCSNVRCEKITTTVNHARHNVLLYIYNHVITTNMCTTYYIPLFQWGSAINWLGGTDTRPLLVVDQLVATLSRNNYSVEVFALALSHYFQKPESASIVVYSFASLPLELIHNIIMILEIVIVQQLFHYISSLTSRLVVLEAMDLE